MAGEEAPPSQAPGQAESCQVRGGNAECAAASGAGEGRGRQHGCRGHLPVISVLV